MDETHFCGICYLRRSEKLILSFIASALTGILSGWGIGGGTLLIIFMTVLQGLSQQTARGINLVYFLPTSTGALFSHIKNKTVNKKAFIFAALFGTVSAIFTALVFSDVRPELLKKLFGVFLMFVGVRELFRKAE